MQHVVTVLGQADTARIEAHLLRLTPRDRSLRFTAGLVTDETIRGYVHGIRFDGDAVLAVVDGDRVVGLAHGCVYSALGELRIEASFSVDEARRNQGLGSSLMAAVDGFAHERGARILLGMCLARNLAMRRIFERHGMTLTREDDEIHACRRVDAHSVPVTAPA